MNALDVLEWLFTYAVHSTILLAGAFVLTRFVSAEAWRDTIWKAALVGGLVSSTLAALPSYDPPAGLWHAGEVVRFEQPALGPGPTVDPLPGRSATEAAPPEVTSAGASESGASGARPGGEAAARPTTLAVILVAGWIFVALLLLARLTAVNLRFFRRLRDREPVDRGPLADMLARLRREVGYWKPIRLTVSTACATPVALGTREICLPVRYACDLDAEQQRAGLAHELAHLRRRDPTWQLFAGLLESAFFFQPLNRVARSALRETAEHLCDDWAVSHTGSPGGLASCLSEIASWVGGTSVPRQFVAIAEGGSPLLTRIRRLAENRVGGLPRTRWHAPGAMMLIGIVTVVAPAVSVDSAPSEIRSSGLACEWSAVDTTIVDAAGLRHVTLRIPAGDVRLAGRPDIGHVRVIARRCGSRAELFDALDLDVRRTDAELDAGFELPTQLFSRTRGSIARIDLTVEVPARLSVEIENGLGEVEISDVDSVRIADSLDDIHVVRVARDVYVEAGPGDVTVTDVKGSALVAQSVGRVVVERVDGDVTLAEGHTGPVEIRGVRADATIGDGQAGDVRVDGVDGDLFLGRMTEGRLNAENVSGQIVSMEPHRGGGEGD